MKRVAIIGAGDLGEQLAYHIGQARKAEVIGFFDDMNTKEVLGLPILGRISDCYKKRIFDEIIIGIGYKHLTFKHRLYLELKQAGMAFHSFIHPSAIIDPSAKVHPGVAIYPGCIVDRNVVIGPNSLLNNGCVVSHDSEIGASSFLAPGCTLSGNTMIGMRNFLGTSSSFRDGIETDDDVHTGVGSAVVENLTEPGTYFGNPAKRYIHG